MPFNIVCMQRKCTWLCYMQKALWKTKYAKCADIWSLTNMFLIRTTCLTCLSCIMHLAYFARRAVCDLFSNNMLLVSCIYFIQIRVNKQTLPVPRFLYVYNHVHV